MQDVISIIIPVYNVEKYLEECLQSIIRQTYKNLEIVMVDDGSTDSSGSICDNYCIRDNRFKVIHKENGGVSSARNVGLKVTTGNYIGFVDPDDWIAKDMYERLYRDINEHNVDVVTCAYYEVCGTNSNTRVFGKMGRISSDEALEDVLGQFRAYLWCRLYKRKVFEGLYFIEGRNFEDVEMIPRIFINSRWVYYDEKPMYYYRIERLGSIVATRSPENLRDYFWSNIDILRNIKNKKPEFSGKAIKGVVIAYLVQHKRFTDVDKITDLQKKELLDYRTVLLKELKDIHYRNELSLKIRGELWVSLYLPSLFIILCKAYRKATGRELG